MRSINLPPALAYKIAKIATERAMSRSEAATLLILGVCGGKFFLAEKGVHTSSGTKKGTTK